MFNWIVSEGRLISEWMVGVVVIELRHFFKEKLVILFLLLIHGEELEQFSSFLIIGHYLRLIIKKALHLIVLRPIVPYLLLLHLSSWPRLEVTP